MKRALLVLGLILLCFPSSQNATASPAKGPANAVKSSPSNEGIGLRRLGVEAGLVDPEGASSTIGFGVLADLGTVAPDIRLSSHLGYWSKSENGFGAEASVHDISVGARATYMFHVVSPKFQPYVGAGLGLHFFQSKVSVPDQNMGGFVIPGFSATDTSTKVGLDLGAGASTPLSPKTNLFGDVWYTVADIDQFSMKAGVSFMMGR